MKKMIRQGLWMFSLVAMALLLTGCGNSQEELSRYIHEVKSRPGRPIEPIPEFKPLERFKYPEDDVRRSPFHPAKQDIDDSAAPDQTRKKQPLEAYPLDALKFVGLLKRHTTVWALIETPGGKVTRIKAGEYMGRNYGKVLDITRDTVKLEETVRVGGKWVKKITGLKLHQKNSGS